MKYRVHRFDLRMSHDGDRLARFLNELDGEVISIIPNVLAIPSTHVNFVLIVEKLQQPAPAE